MITGTKINENFIVKLSDYGFTLFEDGIFSTCRTFAQGKVKKDLIKLAEKVAQDILDKRVAEKIKVVKNVSEEVPAPIIDAEDELFLFDGSETSPSIFDSPEENEQPNNF